MSYVVKSVPVPAHPVTPKLGCMPVRPYLIIISIVGLICGILSLLIDLSKDEKTPAAFISTAFNFTFHLLVLIGSITYESTVLLICQVLCIISIVICAMLFVLSFGTPKLIIVMGVATLFASGLIFIHYACIKRLRKYITDTKGTSRNQLKA